MIISVSYLFGKQHGINKCLLFIFSRAVLCLKLIPYPYFQTPYKLIPYILRKATLWYNLYHIRYFTKLRRFKNFWIRSIIKDDMINADCTCTSILTDLGNDMPLDRNETHVWVHLGLILSPFSLPLDTSRLPRVTTTVWWYSTPPGSSGESTDILFLGAK